MRKYLLALFGLFVAFSVYAGQLTYTGPLVNEDGMTYSKDYDLNLSAYNIDTLSFQAVYSSVTVPSANFFDGYFASGTFVVKSTATAGVRITSATLAINNITLKEGIDWVLQDTTTGTARAISNAIMANPMTNAIVKSTWTAASVVTATSTVVGTAGNFTIWTSTPTAISTSGFTNGSNPTVDYTTDVITTTMTYSNRYFTTGLPVLYTIPSGTTPTGLVVNTTYYAYPSPDYRAFKLALTSTGAIAGLGIDIGQSASVAGDGKFTLTPLALNGNCTFYFMGSNDGSNFVALTASTGTVSASTVSNTSFLQDFASYAYRYIRLRLLKPTTGGAAKIVITSNGKKLD